MGGKWIGQVLVWLTVAASVAAGAAFLVLYRLRNDPQPELGAAFQIAAFLQPIPCMAAVGLAV